MTHRGLCKRTWFAPSAFCLPHLVGGNVRGGTREKSAPGGGLASGVPALTAPARPARPGRGFPGLNGTAAELDRGSGCQLPRLGRGLGKKTCKSSEKVWGRHAHSTPQAGKHEVGRRERGVAGNPGIPAIRGGGGGQKVTINKKRTGSRERRRASER